MEKSFIYALTEPAGGVRYVGKSDSPLRRFVVHLRDKSSRRLGRWIRLLQRSEQNPRLEILEWVDCCGWQEAERKWIAYFRQCGFDLVNHTDGGEGLVNPTRETRRRMSKTQKRLMTDPAYRAKIFTAERNRKISSSLVGKQKAPEHIAKLPQNCAGRKLSPEHAERSREVLRRFGYHWPIGVRPSMETRRKISVALRGNQHTLGRIMPPEERLARSIKQRGAPKTDEHKQRIREGMLRRWARVRMLEGVLQ